MKRIKIIFLILFTSLVSVNTLGADSFGCFPKSKLKLPDYSYTKAFRSESAITRNEQQFIKLAEHFKAYWNPVLGKKYNKQLIINNNWAEVEVNAVTTRDDDNNPVIIFTGGLARHPELTDNGLLLILCHELGHHFGGAPKQFRGRSTKRSWSSAEGQADYFASSKCFNRMLHDGAVMSSAAQLMRKACKSKNCNELELAALSVGRVFASLKDYWEVPNVDQRSSRTVSITQYDHADPQCRFDTYLAGSLCSDVIDIDFDDQDHKVGSCVKSEQPQAARPSCWFSSRRY